QLLIGGNGPAIDLRANNLEGAVYARPRKSGGGVDQAVCWNGAELSIWIVENNEALRYTAAALRKTVIDLGYAAPDRCLASGIQTEQRYFALYTELDIPGIHQRRTLAVKRANCIGVVRIGEAEGVEYKETGRNVLDRFRPSP